MHVARSMFLVPIVLSFVVNCGNPSDPFQISSEPTFIDAALNHSYPNNAIDFREGIFVHPKVVAENKRLEKVIGGLTKKDVSQSQQWDIETKPWAGYWYPYSDKSVLAQDGIYRKLDQWARSKGFGDKIFEEEKQRREIFKPDSWEGMCDAWALASVTFSEPSQAQSFSLAEQKTILTKLSEARAKEYFGIPYRGSAETDGTYQDLLPHVWHRLAQYFLVERKRAFVLDHDATIQVWSKPVYRYKYSSKTDPDVPEAIRVAAIVYMIHHREKETEIRTSEDDVTTMRLVYRLYPNQSGKIVASEWLGDSFKNHPDYAFIETTDSIPKSHNQSLNEISRELLKEVSR